MVMTMSNGEKRYKFPEDEDWLTQEAARRLQATPSMLPWKHDDSE